jgi:hypothetical protein
MDLIFQWFGMEASMIYWMSPDLVLPGHTGTAGSDPSGQPPAQLIINKAPLLLNGFRRRNS